MNRTLDDMLTQIELDQIRAIVREEARAVVHEEMAEMKLYILDFRTEVIQRFVVIEQRLDTIAGLYQHIYKTLPVVVDSTLKTESVMNRLNNQVADLEGRVRKLEGRVA